MQTIHYNEDIVSEIGEIDVVYKVNNEHIIKGGYPYTYLFAQKKGDHVILPYILITADGKNYVIYAEVDKTDEEWILIDYTVELQE